MLGRSQGPGHGVRPGLLKCPAHRIKGTSKNNPISVNATRCGCTPTTSMQAIAPPEYPSPISSPCHQAFRRNCLSSPAIKNIQQAERISIMVLYIQIMRKVSAMLDRTSPNLMDVITSAVPKVACKTVAPSSNMPAMRALL